MMEWDAREDCLQLHDVLESEPILRALVKPHPRKKNKYWIDLGDPKALLAYNKALLKKLERLTIMLPEEALIPSICLRRTLLRVLFEVILGSPPRRMLEIGIGRSAVLAMIAAKRWKVEVWGTDHPDALQWAEVNIKTNELDHRIHLLLAPPESIIKELTINWDELDLILTNPPYYSREDRFLVEKERGFLGLPQELIAGKSPVSFVNLLLSEWQELDSRPKLAMVLPKERWIKELHVSPAQVHRIKAGTRKRYLLLFHE